MALPQVIATSGFLPLMSQGRSKPYISSAGNVYFVQQNPGFVDTVTVYKNTDPGVASWTLVNLQLTGLPAMYGLGTFQVGDNIHIATQDDNEAILYHVYSMSSDSFTTSNEDTGAIGTNIDTDKAISIAVETDGSIIMKYQGVSESVMGAKERVDYAYKVSGGSWVVDQAVDAGGKVHYYLGGIVRGEANKFHLTFKDETNANALHRSVQDVDGTLTAVETMNDLTMDPINFSVWQPVYYDNGGVETITAGFMIQTSNILSSAEILDDATPEPHISVNIHAPNGEFSIVSFAVDESEKKVWALYAGVSEDLFSEYSTEGANWTGSNEELDGVTINYVTSNIYQRGSDIVLAHVYDDAGTIKYNEKVLRSVVTTFYETLAVVSVGVISLSPLTTFFKTLTATSLGVVSLSLLTTFFITLSAVSTATAGMVKRMFVGLSVTATATANLFKGMFQTLSATSVVIVSLSAKQLILRTLAAVSTGISSLATTFLGSVAISVIATGTVVFTSLVVFVQNFVATALGAVSLNVFKTLGGQVRKNISQRLGIMKRGISRFFQ